MRRWLPIHRLVVLLWLSAAVSLQGQPLPFPQPPPLQPPQAGTIPYGGSEYFRFLLYMQKLKPVQEWEEIEESPQQSLIILLGYTGRLPLGLNGARLHDFMRRGGAVLIASEQPTDPMPPDQWPNVFGIRLTGHGLIADPKDCYEGVNRKIFVQPIAQPFQKERDASHAIFDHLEATGEKALATDMPTELEIHRGISSDFYITRLAKYPDSTQRLGQRTLLAQGQNLFAVSLRSRFHGGRMIVLADHGVFVNGMMGIEKNEMGEGITFRNGNFRFANQVTEWLKGGSDEPRNKCLFIENGQIRDTFAREVPNVPPKNPKQFPPEMIGNVLLSHANEWFREAENQNVFNRTLVSSDESYAAYVRSFIYLITGLMLFMALRMFWKAYWKVNKAASESANTLNESLPRGGLVVQQKANQLLLGNLYEAMRIRIRDRFDRLGGQPDDEGEMPPLLIADYQEKAAQIRRDVTTIWQIGYGKTPIFIDSSDWDPLNRDLERLMKQAANGAWSFGQEV